jgi:hypothetical protein
VLGCAAMLNLFAALKELPPCDVSFHPWIDSTTEGLKVVVALLL